MRREVRISRGALRLSQGPSGGIMSGGEALFHCRAAGRACISTEMKSPLVLLALAVLSLSSLSASPQAPILLWPDGVPGEAELQLPPESVEKKGDYQIDILSNVSQPSLTLYPAEKATGTAILVCPGGGYNILATSHEGVEICEWLNRLGITAGLLKYRVPRREGQEKHVPAWQDARRAIQLMRERAAEWKINPERIGVLGFSAGGHLAAVALTGEGQRAQIKASAPEELKSLPDFGLLIYAAYLLDEANPDRLSPEVQVDETTPPTFLAVAHDDRRFVEGSARFYLEMCRGERPAELHIFAKGGHGFGFKNTPEAIRQWPALAEQWLAAQGLLGE